MDFKIKLDSIKNEIFTPEKAITNPNKRRKIDSNQLNSIKIYKEESNNNNVNIKLDKNSNIKRTYSTITPIKKHENFITSRQKKQTNKKTQNVELSSGIYRAPKQILHNTFGTVANRFKNKNLKLTPNYNIVKVQRGNSIWSCSYTIQWPENQTFKQTASTKQRATHEAAFSTLFWLRENKHITRDGYPIIVNSKNKEFVELEQDLYGAPKHVLHNAFHKVSVKFRDDELNVKPSFNIIEHKSNTVWSCKYTLKWPELREFETVGPSKREASEEAALSTLLWLKNSSKITDKGHPIIAKKKENKKRHLRKLPVSQKVHQHLKNIIQDFEQEFLPLSKEYSSDSTIVPNRKDLNEAHKDYKNRFLGAGAYLRKEESQLPISKFKEEIVNLVKENSVIVIKGEPGCGKSTRVPQYILEGWAKDTNRNFNFRVAITQPRRIAAISLAKRVAQERKEQCGKIVGYQIRLNSNFSRVNGKILYCTNGILLRHLQADPSLKYFSHIILDEAHERDANTDILMAVLKNTLKLNADLKIIVMSATIDTELFRNYFGEAPVLHIPGFTHPVQSFFLDDLPASLGLDKAIAHSANDAKPTVAHKDVVKVIEYIHKNKQQGAVLCFLPGWDDICKVQKLIPISESMEVLCLHSKLHDGDQQKIFSESLPEIRKVILSTNIAETSVTIDDVVYVIDCGIHKESRYDNILQVTCVDNQWISQASMIQRRGRAGRVQPGESYHIFTKEKFNKFAEYTDPEILRMSLTKMVLDLKVYSNNMKADEFMEALPTPPKKLTVFQAVTELKQLELLNEDEDLTDLGRIISQFQLHPKLSKTLVNSVIFKCVTPIVDIVTIYANETDLFENSLMNKEEIRKVKTQTDCKNSDHISTTMLVENWLMLKDELGDYGARFFCEDSYLIHENLETLENLREIHFDYLYAGWYSRFEESHDDFSDNDELVKAVLFSNIGTLLRFESRFEFMNGRYQIKDQLLNNRNQKAAISSDSVNFKTLQKSDFFVYVNEIRSNARNVNTIRECSVISPLSLLLFYDKNLLVTEENELEISLKLEGTGIEFSSTHGVASDIEKCKQCLKDASKYLINEVTRSGTFSPQIETVWNKILENLNAALSI